MRPGARLQAAIEILTVVLERGRPAALALADWGRANRFAGSGDRAAIGNLVYDCLRKKLSLSWRMGPEPDTPRALALGALRYEWGESPEAVAALCDGSQHGPEPLTSAERAGLESGRELADAPPWVRGDYPDWLHPEIERTFGERAAEAGAALASRAPIDLRVNTLKAARDKVLRSFVDHAAGPAPYSPIGVRIPPRSGGGRSPNVEASPAHGKGWFEVQDEGSQLAALLAGAAPRMQVADICAGGGGKTLAFAAAMQNTGQIFAYDADPSRFRPIFERLRRAGARNVQTLEPGKPDGLSALNARMDLVLVDAPCSGTGVWRRKPDSKWRLTPQQVEDKVAIQRDILKSAAALVKPGGALAYVTCSILHAENDAQAQWFLENYKDFETADLSLAVQSANRILPPSANSAGLGYALAPHSHGTDGFYVILFRKRSAGAAM